MIQPNGTQTPTASQKEENRSQRAYDQAVGLRCNEAGEGCLDSTHGHAFRVIEDNSLPLQQYLSSILDGEEIKLFLHAEVIEGQIDSALRVGDDQPHAVHVVTVLLRVVGRQQHTGWSGKVEET